MANKNSNYPANQLNNTPEGTNTDLIHSIRELAQQGKPHDVEELKTRIDMYFGFCERRDFRCGVESLSLSLGVTRQTFWNWCNGTGVSEEWQEICLVAKQYILTFIEAVSLSGRLNPATSCFILKNWGNYKDSISFDETPSKEATRHILSSADLPQLDVSESYIEEQEE